MSTVTLGLLQHACTANPAQNLKKTLALTVQAAKAGAKIICTQELFRSQYFCQSEDHALFNLAESIPGPSTAAFQQLAKKYKVVIIASLFEKRASGLYHNTAVIIDAGRQAPRHLPEDAHPGRSALLREILLHPGRHRLQGLADQVRQDRRAHLLGPVVPRRAPASPLQGAEILFYPTAIGWHPKERRNTVVNQHGAWETIQRSHAVANGCYVAAVNRIGLEQPVGGDGSSSGARALSPARAARSSPRPVSTRRRVLLVPIDLGKVDVTRTHWPFLRDRRIDAYGI
jgi:N-carbamoylputrescine amidase